jgi:teichuronic acid biosynthesis protein TuaE
MTVKPTALTGAAQSFALMTDRLRKALSLSEILRWGFILLLPLAVLGSVAAWPGLRTISAFRVLYVALALGTAAWILYHRRLPFRTQVTTLVLFLGFWTAWTLVSLLWAEDKVAGIRYTVFLTMMASLTVGTVLAVNDLRTLRIALLLLLLVFGAALGIALLEILTDFRLPTSMLVGTPARYQWAATSIFHNQNDFATYIALWMPFLLAAPFLVRRISVVLPAIACAFLSALCLLYTGSRTNLLALIVIAPAMLAVLALRRGTKGKRWQWVVGMAFLLAVACFLFLGARGELPLLRLPWIGVQHWRFDTLETEIDEGFGSGGTRINLIEGGVRVALGSRLLGVGPGNAEYHLRQIPGLEAVPNLHNWWLEVLVNGGVLVFAGYLAFYGILLWGLFRVARDTGDGLTALAATSLFAALVGYVLGSLSPSSAIHFTPMWIHFGLGLAVLNLHRGRGAAGRVAE